MFFYGTEGHRSALLIVHYHHNLSSILRDYYQSGPVYRFYFNYICLVNRFSTTFTSEYKIHLTQEAGSYFCLDSGLTEIRSSYTEIRLKFVVFRNIIYFEVKMCTIHFWALTVWLRKSKDLLEPDTE